MWYTETLNVYVATSLDRNFLFSLRVARSQTRRSSSKAKHAINLKLVGGLPLGKSLSNVHTDEKDMQLLHEISHSLHVVLPQTIHFQCD